MKIVYGKQGGSECILIIFFIIIFYPAGRGGLQLLSRWPVTRGYPCTWHTCRSVYLDR